MIHFHLRRFKLQTIPDSSKYIHHSFLDSNLSTSFPCLNKGLLQSLPKQNCFKYNPSSNDSYPKLMRIIFAKTFSITFPSCRNENNRNWTNYSFINKHSPVNNCCTTANYNTFNYDLNRTPPQYTTDSIFFHNKNPSPTAIANYSKTTIKHYQNR